jgi:[ribosomal protein S5]-alanine N-acetyltransferase
MHPGLDRLLLSDQSTVLRRMREADLPLFHAYRSDPDLARYQGWSAMSEQESLEFIRDVAKVEALRVGGWVQLAIADQANDSLLGDIGLFVDDEQQEAEVGFTLSQTAQGSGHATRAVKAAVEMLFAITSVALVRAVTDARNTKSIGVLERAGFRKSREQSAVFKGEECLEYVYTLPRGDA